MNIQKFEELTKNLLYVDGATGTQLYHRGMPKGVCTEAWVLEHPETIIDLQNAYAEAGSQIVYAPTFGANRTMLKKHGLENDLEQMNVDLVELSKRAVGGRTYIAGDLAPTGLVPVSVGGDASDEEIFEVYREQAQVLDRAGVDLFVAETMMGLDETVIAVDAVRSVTDKPIMCTMSVNVDGTAYYGGTIFEAAETLQEIGANAVGLNCCSGPDQVLSLITSIKKIVHIPVIAKPNAGMPVIDESGNAVYDMGPQEFAMHMKTLVEAGASVIGGCCGTGPEYIRKLRLVMEGRSLV